MRAVRQRDTEGIGRGTFDAQAFDAVMIAFLAALQAGSSDPAAIRDNLQAVSGPPGTQYTFEELDDAINAILAGEDIDYEGASGSVNLDENGDPGAEGSSYQFFEYKNGKLVPIEAWVVMVDFLKKNGWQACVWDDGPVSEPHLDYLMKRMN